MTLRHRIVAGIAVLVLLPAFSGCGRRDAVAPPLRIATAWDEFRLSEYTSAVRLFESVATDPAAAPLLRQEAVYGMAEIWRTRLADTDVSKARRLHEWAIEIAPTNDVAAWSRLALARMRHMGAGADPFAPGVIEEYESVARAFPDHPAGEEAYMHICALRLCRQSSNDVLRAQAEIHSFLAQRPGSPYRSLALGLKAYTHEMLGQHAAFRARVDRRGGEGMNEARWRTWTLFLTFQSRNTSAGEALACTARCCDMTCAVDSMGCVRGFAMGTAHRFLELKLRDRWSP